MSEGQRSQTKKNRQALLAVSRLFGVLRVLSTLSIRQRSEIPKEVKIKLRGEHGGIGSLRRKG
ncbi:hypothetical protein [Paraburkholderia bannensis]|uniref:hypothetical protein n=1 Tax=Paraburkholderia bannensis TaxID=765414 RepID=UPI002ABE6447|nr:hypothetical protein [Paraburkholderia bannensis]